ncbi:FliH/SctL family protein [Nocardioides psychrotolerans]|uniref:FliH/SctL family protein n=1 Tax=Nocardioides psychrotolerans TaxID=1005945 RepID=UPI003138230E
MSSSTEARPETGPATGSETGAAVLRGASADAASSMGTPELRSGSWTRFGDRSVLGDAVTEQVLSGLAESTRTAARSQGYAVGWAEGRREAAVEAAAVAAVAEEQRCLAEVRREAEHRAALDALVEAAASLQQTLARVSTRVEDQALLLARELTEALVHHELRLSPDLGEDVVRRALRVLPAGLPVTLRLHPCAATADAVSGLVEQGVRVVADASLMPGDAVVEADDHVVDLCVGSALERMREALS